MLEQVWRVTWTYWQILFGGGAANTGSGGGGGLGHNNTSMDQVVGGSGIVLIAYPT